MRRALIGIMLALVLMASGCGDDDDDAGTFCDALREVKTFIEGIDGPLDDEQTDELHDIIGRARSSAPDELDDIDEYLVNTETFIIDGDLAFGNELSQEAQAEYSAQGDTLARYATDTCGLEGFESE